jgi:hypothetical protein
MPDYEVLDLSASGPRRGLLMALESVHPIRTEAPPPSKSAEVRKPQRDATDDRVLAQLRFSEWTPTPLIAKRAQLSATYISKVLLRLLRAGLLERRMPPRASFRFKRAAEWRRVS